MKLTDLSLRNLKPPERGARIYADDQITGFGCRATATGVKAFVLTLPGSDRQRVTIGRYPVISLSEARAEAKRILAERTLGKTAPPRVLFGEALGLFLETRRQRNRPRSAKETQKVLTNYYKKLHPFPLENIRAHHIADIVDDLSKRGLRGAAIHAHSMVKTFFRFCVQRGYLDLNPVDRLERPITPPSRERVLTDEELRAIWKASDDCGTFGNIVKLLLLTGQRRTEIASLQREWIDLEKNLLCIPNEYTKNKRQHVFPVGALTAKVLHSTSPATGLLFPVPGKNIPFIGWSWAKTQLDKKITDQFSQPINMVPWTLHDLRRTMATRMAEQGTAIHVIERLLNHVGGQISGVAAVYNRASYMSEMAEAVAWWDGYVRRICVK